MKKASSERPATEMRADYDFSGGIPGKYAQRYQQGTNVVIINPELAKFFPDSESVNGALRALVTIATRADARKRS